MNATRTTLRQALPCWQRRTVRAVLLMGALAGMTLGSTAQAQIAFRSATSAFIGGGGGTPVAPTLRSSASAVITPGPNRWYTVNINAAVDPATVRGNWVDGKTTYKALALSRTKSRTNVSFGSGVRSTATSPGRVMQMKLISDPIPTAQTIAGTLDWVVGVGETSTSQNSFHKLHVYVLREPDTLVGTLLGSPTAYEEASTSGNEWAASGSAVGKGPAGAVKPTLTSVAAQAGDRIVIEFGWVGYSTRTGDTGYYYYGGGTNDMAVGGVTNQASWFEFSQDIFGSSIAKPSGTVAGDVMIASIAVRPNTATITPPSGWTPVQRVDNSAGTESLAIYQRTVDASDSSVTGYVWSTSGATFAMGTIQSFSGVDTANPIDVWNGQATASSTTHVTPDVTTTVANTLLVTTHAMSSGSVYWTPPTGMTEIVDVEVGSTTGGIALEGSTAVQATAGATGAKTATNGANTTPYPGVTHILALRGVASGGGGGNALSINAPAGLAQNDVMIASISFGPSTATINAPQGWTLVRRMDNTNGTSNSLAVYKLLAGATEPAVYNWTLSNGHTGAAGGIQAFSGADPAIDAENGQTDTASVTSHATPSVNTTYTNTMIITSYGVGATSTWTQPLGMNETADAQGGSQAFEMNWVLQAAPASNISKTATSSSTGYGNAHILALRRVLGNFNAFETLTGAGTSGVIKTKIAGTSVSLATISVNAAKSAVATTFVGTVKIEVLNASDNSAALDANGCRSTWTLIQALSPDTTFTAADNGRKNISFTVPNSYRDVRLRMTSPPAGGPDVIIGCSSDNFSIRPLAFSSVTSNMTNSATTGAPVTSAGGSFSITGVAIAGYNGTPALDNTKITAHAGAVQTGSVAGSFGAADPATGTATGSTFTYSEVGNFTIGVNGVYDSTFTAVDAPGTECTNDFSNTLVGGSYGCSFGNSAASAAVGRFRPDHFIVTLGTLTNRQALSCAPASTYTYEGEPLRVTFALTARNGLGTPAITQNYTTASGFAKLDGTVYANFGFGAVDLADATPPLAATALTARVASGTSSGTWVGGSGSFTVDLSVSRVSPDGPFESFRLGVLPADTDGVTLRAADLNLDTSVPADSNDRVLLGSSKIRFGRLALRNASGSQLVRLPVPLETQYWNGTAFITNDADNCTTLATNNVAMSNFTSNLAACETANTAVSAFARGRSILTLAAPGSANNGSVDLAVNLGLASSGTTCTSVGPSTVPACTVESYCS